MEFGLPIFRNVAEGDGEGASGAKNSQGKEKTDAAPVFEK